MDTHVRQRELARLIACDSPVGKALGRQQISQLSTSEPKLWPRSARSMRVWRIVTIGVALLCIGQCLASIVFELIVRRPLYAWEGGALAVLLVGPVAAVTVGLVGMYTVRRLAIRRRISLSHEAFVDSSHLPDVPREIVHAVRAAMGNAYVVAPLLIKPEDDGHSLGAISLGSDPLLREVIEDILGRLNRSEECERIVTTLASDDHPTSVECMIADMYCALRGRGGDA